jgi:hypothetical protein
MAHVHNISALMSARFDTVNECLPLDSGQVIVKDHNEGYHVASRDVFINRLAPLDYYEIPVE